MKPQQNHSEYDKSDTAIRITKPVPHIKMCNLCKNRFKAGNVHILFCEMCRRSSDVLKFSEWLPELPNAYNDEIKNVA